MKYKTYTKLMYLMCIPENIHPPRRQRKFKEVGGGGLKEVISKGVGGGLLIKGIPGGGGGILQALLRSVGF